MFEKEMENKLKRIFKVKKVTYEQPSDMREQECIFIEIENATNNIKKGSAIAVAKVTGNVKMFGDAEKMPFGFFSKCIAEANPDDAKDFFFSDLESNTKYYGNLVERGFNFLYLFRGQYDPNVGSITSLETKGESDT